ncbi:MAG: hypothetical protein MJ094_01210 [Saccharofermentans sp.]|nr:hypothetical protein [Saccharofermentans sp.]
MAKRPDVMKSKKDIVEFFIDYSGMPEKYATPPKWYSEKRKIKTRSYRKIMNKTIIDKNKLHKYYEAKLASIYDSVLTVNDVANFTGYGRKAVSSWINKKKLRAIPYKHSFFIPQE